MSGRVMIWQQLDGTNGLGLTVSLTMKCKTKSFVLMNSSNSAGILIPCMLVRCATAVFVCVRIVHTFDMTLLLSSLVCFLLSLAFLPSTIILVG